MHETTEYHAAYPVLYVVSLFLAAKSPISDAINLDWLAKPVYNSPTWNVLWFLFPLSMPMTWWSASEITIIYPDPHACSQFIMFVVSSILNVATRHPWNNLIATHPIGSMYAIYGNIYHQYTPNVSIYTIYGSYGHELPEELPSTPKAPRFPTPRLSLDTGWSQILS